MSIRLSCPRGLSAVPVPARLASALKIRAGRMCQGVAAILGLMAVEPSPAQMVQYTDRAAWEAAVAAAGGSVQTESFNDNSTFTASDNGVAVGPPVSFQVFDHSSLDTLTTPVVKILAEIGSGGQEFSLEPAGATGEITDGTPFLRGFGTTSGAPKIRVERASGAAAMAWGVDFKKASAVTTWRAEVVTVTGQTTTYSLPVGASGFIGWVVPDGYLELKSLRLYTPSAGYTVCGYDNISVGMPAVDMTDAAVQVESPAYITDGGTKDFGTIYTPFSDVVFTARNTGTVPLTGLAVSVDGTDASRWTVLTPPAGTLAVGGVANWTMRFQAGSPGTKTAVMHLTSSVVHTRKPYDITLTGSGVPDIVVTSAAGEVVPDGSSLALGQTLMGGARETSFTVRNAGAINLTDLAVTIDGADAGEFSISADPAGPVIPGGTTTFTVRHTAVTLGIKSVALHIASNDPTAKNPYDINLSAIVRSSTPITGSLTVGPTGDYASLTAAIADIQTKTPSGPLLLELQPAYVCTVETFPIVFSHLATTATNTLTIRPQAGAIGLSITSADSTAATVDLDGAQFVSFDGRPGGVGGPAAGGSGSVSQLVIENTSSSGVAVRLINEASYNNLRFITLRSVNASASSGTVYFGGTTGSGGNDYNTIDHCDIRDGASTPVNAVYSRGTAGKENNNNTVSRCNIYNFYATASAQTSSGVLVADGNQAWTIADNSFFQTASRTGAPSSSIVPVYIAAADNTCRVTGNAIGGSEPNAGGTPWTVTGAPAVHSFCAIRVHAGGSIQGNTVANFAWSTSTSGAGLPGAWCGIYVSGGNATVGTTAGNTIGRSSGTGSISVTAAGLSTNVYGIGSASSGTVAISNNRIGSIATDGLTPSVGGSITAISITGGANTISGNLVGSLTTPNSISASIASIAILGQQVTGISSTNASNVITGNIIANLNNNFAGSSTAGHIRGIVTSSGTNRIAGNTVRNLSTTSRNSSSVTPSVIGISLSSNSIDQIIADNTVHSLASLATAGAVQVAGILFNGLSNGTGLIARNVVHSLAAGSSVAASSLNGIIFNAGAFTAENNMVRLGLKADGTSTAGVSIVRGIYDNGPSTGRNFHHNSVYIGGIQTSGSSSSFALNGITGTTNLRSYLNNIFVNARSNAGGTGSHYAVAYGGTAPNPSGLTSNGNIFLATGTGGLLGLYNAVGQSDLAAWQAATGQDANSFRVDPRFINPAGTAATVDLHLQTVNPAEGQGVATAGTTDDVEGQMRADYTAVDIGADAGSFTFGADSTELNPLITFTPAADTSSYSSPLLSAFAVITDDGDLASGPNAPRLYFKKASDANSFTGNTAADPGWKYVLAENDSSPYDFRINYPLLTGNVAYGEVIEYFIAAQDSHGNFSSSPPGAAFADSAAPVTTVNSSPANPARFSFLSNALASLTLSSGTLDPAFDPANYHYRVTLDEALTSLLINPVTEDPTAVVKVNDASADTPVLLAPGSNAITITVTAADGLTRTYTLNAIRAAAGTPFQQWAALHSVPATVDLPGSNGQPNLLNFAFGVDPVSGGNDPLQFTGTLAAGGNLVVTGQPITRFEPAGSGVDFRALFVRRKDHAAAGLTYTAEFSADLSVWQASAAVPVVLADDGTHEVASVRYPFFIAGKKARFFRISVNLAP